MLVFPKNAEKNASIIEKGQGVKGSIGVDVGAVTSAISDGRGVSAALNSDSASLFSFRKKIHVQIVVINFSLLNLFLSSSGIHVSV